MDSIRPKNKFRSLVLLNKEQKKDFKHLMQLRQKVKCLPLLYREIIYNEKGLELINESKCNPLYQINWRNCSNYFFTCVSNINRNFFENFMKESKFQNLSKLRIISFHKKQQSEKKQFDRVIASVKWYNIIIQLDSSLTRIENYLKYLFFDLWFFRLYQEKNLEFTENSPSDISENENEIHNTDDDNKKSRFVVSGILKRRDHGLYLERCKRNDFFYFPTTSRLFVKIDNVDFSLQHKQLTLPCYLFGIYYFYNQENNGRFLQLNVKSIPNTQQVLNEFFKNDIFYQDLITEGLEKQLYAQIKQFPSDICLLITQYLRSIFFTPI